MYMVKARFCENTCELKMMVESVGERERFEPLNKIVSFYTFASR